MNELNDTLTFSLTFEQWFLLFFLALGILVLCSFVTMISVWFVNNRLKEISEKLDSKNNTEADKTSLN